MTSWTVTVSPIVNSPLAGGGLWRAGRFWPNGTTNIEVVPNEWYEPEYFGMIANQVEADFSTAELWTPRKLQPQSADVLAALAAESGGISPVDIAPSTAAPGTFEDTSTRTTLGQRALRALLADDRLDVKEVVP